METLNGTNQTITFENVTIYRMGLMFGTHRTDCRTLKLTFDLKYAQYSDALRVEYVEKGKRTLRAAMLCGEEKWIRACKTADAIDVGSSMVPTGTPGCSQSRYTSCDPRWQTDFEDKAEAAGVRWLVSIGIGAREGEHLDRCLKTHPAKQVTA